MKQGERLHYVLSTIKERPGITAAELAELCKVSPRTIYRYIQSMDNLGVRIGTETNKGYKLIESPVPTTSQLSSEEFLAISLFPLLTGQTKMKQNALYKPFESAMQKIVNRFKVNDDLLKLSKKIRIHAPKEEREQEQVLQAILESIAREVTIICDYYTMSRDSLTEKRMIDPYELVLRQGHLYVIGYCHTRDDVRTFRLSRFQAVEVTEKKYYVLDDFHVDTHYQNTWGATADAEQVTFTIRFSKEVARYIREERYHIDVRYEEEKDGSLLMQATTRGVEEFLRWVKQYGEHAVILEPKEFREKLLEEYRELVRLYEKKS